MRHRLRFWEWQDWYRSADYWLVAITLAGLTLACSKLFNVAFGLYTWWRYSAAYAGEESCPKAPARVASSRHGRSGLFRWRWPAGRGASCGVAHPRRLAT